LQYRNQPIKHKKVNNWLNYIQMQLLPPRCLLCGQAGINDMDLCISCLADLPRNRHCCAVCALPLPESVPERYCGRCVSKPPSFATTSAPFLYQHSLPFLIAQLKFARHPRTARLLAQLMAREINYLSSPPQCLIPVPLHPARYRERGFNQAEELALHLNRFCNIPLDNHCCRRIRDTPHQTRLKAKQRRKNLNSAFEVTPEINYQHIALIDDVMTTGTTANALASLLVKQGVKRVEIWVCARA
jgi:ComF family protein